MNPLLRPVDRAAAVALVIVAMLLVTLVSPAAPARAASASTTEASASVTAREPLARFRCSAWRQMSPKRTTRTCARLTSIEDRTRVDFRDRVRNRSDRAIKRKCVPGKPTTWRFGVNVSGEIKTELIFEKVQASARASVSRTASTAKRMGGALTIPPRASLFCERGMHGLSFSGVVRVESETAQGRSVTKRRFSGSAPSSSYFEYGVGRGGGPRMEF